MKKYILPGWEPVSTGWNWRRLIRPLALAAIICIAAVFVSKLKPHPNSPQSQVIDVSSLGNFEFDGQHGKLADVPEQYRKLDGRQVTIRGLVWAPASVGLIQTEFQCVAGFSEHSVPLVQNRIFCHLPNRMTVPYYSGPVLVTGIFHVRVENPTSEKVISVFSLDVQSVTPDNPGNEK